MSDSNGSGMTADGRYSYSYSINAISSSVAPNDEYPQCAPVRIDNYKALITLTPTGTLSGANTIIYKPSVTAFSQAPTQSRRSVVVTQTLQEQEQPLNLAYAMPSASTARRYSVVDEQPANLAYAMPSVPRRYTTQEQQQEQPTYITYTMPSPTRNSPQSARRISVVQQEPAQSWSIASNNSFETVNNNNSNSSNGNTIYVTNN